MVITIDKLWSLMILLSHMLTKTANINPTTIPPRVSLTAWNENYTAVVVYPLATSKNR